MSIYANLSVQWSGTIHGIQLSNIIVTSVLVWILLCSIILGFKEQNWRRKPAKSSFTTGFIFLIYITAVFVLLCSYVVYIVLIHFFRLALHQSLCNDLFDAVNVLVHLKSMLTIIFLYAYTRKIYEHPCVKWHIGKKIDD